MQYPISSSQGLTTPPGFTMVLSIVRLAQWPRMFCSILLKSKTKQNTKQIKNNNKKSTDNFRVHSFGF